MSFISLELLRCQQPWIVPQRSRFKNTNIASLPASMHSTPKKSLASPLCVGSLSLHSSFIFLSFIFHRTMHGHLLFFNKRKRNPNLLRAKEVSPLEKYIQTSDFNFLALDFPLITSLLYWKSIKTQVDLYQVDPFR